MNNVGHTLLARKPLPQTKKGPIKVGTNWLRVELCDNSYQEATVKTEKKQGVSDLASNTP